MCLDLVKGVENLCSPFHQNAFRDDDFLFFSCAVVIVVHLPLSHSLLHMVINRFRRFPVALLSTQAGGLTSQNIRYEQPSRDKRRHRFVRGRVPGLQTVYFLRLGVDPVEEGLGSTPYNDRGCDSRHFGATAAVELQVGAEAAP